MGCCHSKDQPAGEVDACSVAKQSMSEETQLLHILQKAKVHRVLGVGQSSTVQLMEAPSTNMLYAVKAIPKSFAYSNVRLQQLANEVNIGRALNNRFCVRLYGAFENKTHFILVQEYMPGGDLFGRLAQSSTFDETTAMFYTASVVLGLQQLHAHDIIYRDLKPENVLLSADGYLRLADFGFAKQLVGTRSNTRCGTPEYQSPEIVNGDGAGKETDMWSLGILIYEMFAGKTPFDDKVGTQLDMYRRILAGRFVMHPQIPADAASLIGALLKLDPASRLTVEKCKQHPWLIKFDWSQLESGSMTAPWRPILTNACDTCCFEEFDDSPLSLSGLHPIKPSLLSQDHDISDLY